jgi:hypothetical protein
MCEHHPTLGPLWHTHAVLQSYAQSMPIVPDRELKKTLLVSVTHKMARKFLAFFNIPTTEQNLRAAMRRLLLHICRTSCQRNLNKEQTVELRNKVVEGDLHILAR